MPMNDDAMQFTMGLLPDPERRPASFITSATVNLIIVALVLYIGMTAKHVLEQHRYEQTVLVLPTTPPPPLKMKIPAPPKIAPPKIEQVKLEPPKILLPKLEPKPDIKPIQMEAKVTVPTIKARASVVLAPQPKAALAAAAPAQTLQARPSTAPVHLGDTFGVTPNPNATRPATVAAIGNPYGGMNGAATAPLGVVGSTGIGNGTRSGSNGGAVGHVASAGIPSAITQAAALPQTIAAPATTNLEIISKPPVQYTAEARQLKVQGEVVLRVTFTAGGVVVVQGILHGLGHGLDEEACRVAQQIRFRPVTRDGQPKDLTTNITITFQLA